MKILHVVPCADEANGVYHVARMLAKRQTAEGNEASVVTAHDFSTSTFNLHRVDEVYVHGMWLPREWRACCKVLRAQKSNRHSTPAPNTYTSRPRLVRMTHGSLSPIYLERKGKWRKRLAAPIERWLFSKADRVVVTGEWEEAWCRQWGLKGDIQVVDLKQFFCLSEKCEARGEKLRTGRPLHVLHLGMRHPLKGVQYLERAVREINHEFHELTRIELRVESKAFGEEKENAWEWADVLCLPTLSENFGLVVGEALERGKPVITTDGAQAWSDLTPRQGCYLKGYVAGSEEYRIRLLKDALKYFIG